MKRDTTKKSESSTRLLQSVQNLRLENDKQNKTIHDLHMKLQNANVLKAAEDRMCGDLKVNLNQKEMEIDALNKQVVSIEL